MQRKLDHAWTKEYLEHDEVQAVADLSQLVRVGPMLFTSGQIGTGPDGEIVSGDAEEQIAQAFENLRKVLEVAGASLADVVKLTSYLVDLADRPTLRRVKRKYFQHPFPASTLVVVKQLASPTYLYEVEAIAVLGAEHGEDR